MLDTDNRLSRFKGFSNELIVASKFASVGSLVSFPLVPCRYDLIVDQGGLLFKVQVKLACYVQQRTRKKGQGDAACYRINLKANSRSNHNRYVQTDFDYFCSVCRPDLIYVVPVTSMLSPLGNGNLVGTVQFKDLLPSNRADNKSAVERWDKYINNFTLERKVSHETSTDGESEEVESKVGETSPLPRSNEGLTIPGLNFRVPPDEVVWYQDFVNCLSRQPTDHHELARFIAERKQG